ncbi:DUF3307 domain-containing protein [Streptomyces sp. NBC_01142]|uniref:DUF3307 domain-containing protein n=1 Tax=Streptomyces sp. NBC_01142 TaxID=2975865 RepID=UPI00225AD605|nr:DUF3307 domain-containing protein [Streptomyces sp. NBC_01142]MCX4826599.1 DUF3307 domain-containing protein [Streptomyces sp. NBC_01142]
MLATVFVLLYAAHLIADYALQTDHQAEHKAERGVTGWCANLSHAATHVLVSAVLLSLGTVVLDLSLSGPVTAAVLGWIGASHAFLDRRWPVLWWMEHVGNAPQCAARGGAAFVDQTAHVTALVLAALAAAA